MYIVEVTAVYIIEVSDEEAKTEDEAAEIACRNFDQHSADEINTRIL